MNKTRRQRLTFCAQSASYASTAGTLSNIAAAGPSYAAAQVPDSRVQQQYPKRPIASPHSASGAVASHAHAYASSPGPYTTNAMGSAGIGLGPSAGPPDLRLAVPVTTSQTTSWHQPSAHYSHDLVRGSWDYSGGYMSASPATGMPGSAQAYSYHQQRIPPMSGHAMASDSRTMHLHNYDDQSQQVSRA